MFIVRGGFACAFAVLRARASHANPPGTTIVEAYPTQSPEPAAAICLGKQNVASAAGSGSGFLLLERAIVATWSNGNEEPVRAMTPHDGSIYERPTLPEALPHNIDIERPRSLFARAATWLVSIAKKFAMAMRRPRLTDYLPPVPAAEMTHDSMGVGTADARAERMLLDILCAPPEYIDAAILMARATLALRKRGHDVFAEGFVVFALSRMLPDADGTIPIKRLRDHVYDFPVARGIVPVLLRLEEQGVLSLEAPLEQSKSSGMIDMDRMRIRLLVVP